MEPRAVRTSAREGQSSACVVWVHDPVWRSENLRASPRQPRAVSVVSAPQSRGRPRSGRTYRSLHSRAISEPAEARPRPLPLRQSARPPQLPKHRSVWGKMLSVLPWHRQRTHIFPPTQQTVAQAAALSTLTFRYPDAQSLTDISVREAAPLSTVGGGESPARDFRGAAAFGGTSAYGGETCGGPESITDGIYDSRRYDGTASFTPDADRIGSAVFCLLGFTTLIGWNFTMNLAPYMSTQLFTDSAMHWDNSFLAMFQLATLLVQGCLLYIGALRKSLLVIGGWLSVIVFSTLTPVIVYLPENIAITSMHIMCLLTGLSAGLLQGAGFVIAGAMPKNFVGALSVGHGLAGVGAFLLSTLLGFAVFPLDTRPGVRTTAWTVYLFSALVALIYTASISYLLQQPWARHALKKAAQQRLARKRLAIRRRQEREIDDAAAEAEEIENNVEGSDIDLEAPSDGEGSQTVVHGPVEEEQINQCIVEACVAPSSMEIKPADPEMHSMWHVLRSVLPELLAIFLNFFITMNLFPRVGPVSWNYNQSVPNHFLILFGVYSIGDVIGRWLPDLSHETTWLSWLMLPRKWLLPAVIARTLFYIPFCLAYMLEGVPVINDMWWCIVLMLLFAVTHGWATTLSYIYCVSETGRLDEEEITGPLAVIALSLGLVAGLYTAFLVY